MIALPRFDRVTVCLTFLSVGASLAVPYCLMYAIDDGLKAAAFAPALRWSCFAALAQIVASITSYLGRVRANREALSTTNAVLHALFTRAIHADFKAITESDQRQWPGQMLNTASSYGEWVSARYTLILPMLISGACTGIVLLSLSWQLALLSLILFPVCLWILIVLRKHIRRTTRDQMAAQETLYGTLTEVFASLVPIRALGKEKTVLTRFCQACTQNVASQIAQFSIIAKQGPIFDIYQAIILIAVFGIGGWYVAQGTLSIGLIVGFQLYLTRLFGLMRNGANVFSAYHQFLEGHQRAADIEALTQDSGATFASCASPKVLEISHLSFSFGEHEIWHDFSLTLSRGDRRSILLCSGSGKTTLARLILGLYRPDAGTIALCEKTASRIGFVPQENFITFGDLRENIEFLSGPISDQDYQELLEICHLEEIQTRSVSLPKHALCHILSGGEQRRVMLARALAIKPTLLMIDQMTSDLEPALCDAIFSDLDSHFPDLATLYLGHRAPFPDRTREP